MKCFSIFVNFFLLSLVMFGLKTASKWPQMTSNEAALDKQLRQAANNPLLCFLPLVMLLWPPNGLQMASNDSDELSGLNNPCWSLCLAPKCFFEPFQRKKKEGQNGHVDLRARTSPQVKI